MAEWHGGHGWSLSPSGVQAARESSRRLAVFSVVGVRPADADAAALLPSVAIVYCGLNQ